MNQNFSAEQKRLLAEMQKHFGIDPKNVLLDTQGDLFFYLDELHLLRIKLAPDIQDLSINAHTYENEIAIVNSHASIRLQDGRSCSCVKGAMVGEEIANGKIETLIDAADIADGRAARACLRAVAFDPVREFQNYLQGQETTREIPALSQAEKDRRFIHQVRDELDMDDATYRQHLSTVTMGEKTTTEGMTESQLSMCALFFRGLTTAFEKRRKAA